MTTPSDQTVKQQLVLLTAFFGIVGFFLEVGPVGGVFSLAEQGPRVLSGLALGLLTLGFLPYLSLAASAAIGLHLSETEPRPKEPPEEPTMMQPTPKGEAVGERVRVRPELHQFRMFFTAVGGYAVLKGVNLALMWPRASWYGLPPGRLVELYEFGFIYVALAWFVLWQFLRWYARQRRWVRLQEELIGGEGAWVIAALIVVRPVTYLISVLFRPFLLEWPLLLLTLLLHATVIAGAIAIWKARPSRLRRTMLHLVGAGTVIILLTLLLALVEWVITRTPA